MRARLVFSRMAADLAADKRGRRLIFGLARGLAASLAFSKILALTDFQIYNGVWKMKMRYETGVRAIGSGNACCNFVIAFISGRSGREFGVGNDRISHHEIMNGE